MAETKVLSAANLIEIADAKVEGYNEGLAEGYKIWWETYRPFHSFKQNLDHAIGELDALKKLWRQLDFEISQRANREPHHRRRPKRRAKK